MPYDSKLWVDKRLGSHVVLSELSTCAPLNFAPAFFSTTFPGMLPTLSPMLGAPVDQPQQHQQAQQQQDRATSIATTSGEIFSYDPPSVLRASVNNNDSSYQPQNSSLLFPSSTSLSSNSAVKPLPPTSKGLLWAMESGQSQTVIAMHMKGTTEAAAPLRHYKKIKLSCLHHAGAASAATTAALSSATVAISRACTAATTRGITMPAGVFYEGNGMGGRKGKERNGEAQWKEVTRTCGPFHHQASALPHKRRAPRMDLSKLTADEQERWKKARARQYSASARHRQMAREQDLRNQVEISSIFQVLVEAAPDAVLLLSRDARACILFANDQSGHLLRLDSSGEKGKALVGRSLWEWMDAQDKAAVVAAIGVCIFCKDATKRVQCTLYSPRSPFALQPGGAMPQQGHQEPQHYQQQWQQQQEAIRADLTFRSSERGLVVFIRPDKTGVGKGRK
jgi:PAS domain-containing protein